MERDSGISGMFPCRFHVEGHVVLFELDGLLPVLFLELCGGLDEVRRHRHTGGHLIPSERRKGNQTQGLKWNLGLSNGLSIAHIYTYTYIDTHYI